MDGLVGTELLQQRGLIKLPLHPFTNTMKKGKYFQHPNREMLLGQTMDSFNLMELDRIKFIKDCKTEGIHLPQLIFDLGASQIATNETQLDAAKLRDISVPEDGILQTYVRYTDSYVREMRFMSGLGTIMKVTTPFTDGQQLMTKIDATKEIVGYFGYLNETGLVMAIGLILA